MQIYYISNCMSETLFSEYLERYNNRLQQQAQKYHSLLIKGLVFNKTCVKCISKYPINRNIEKKVLINGKIEQESGVRYDYVSFINLPILRDISTFLGTLRRLFMADKNTVLICDALNIAMSLAVIVFGKLFKIKTVALITDVPCYRPYSGKVPFYDKLSLRLMKKYDKYVLLTEEMNKIVNPHSRPYIVMEGHVDGSVKNIENDIDSKYQKKVCLYAGALRSIYGIDRLVEGFANANICDAELHIYGQGDYEEKLKEYASLYSNIKYYGVAPNSVILEEERKAVLLINPRPTDEEYTMYSFPSKNMEYMASGTPVLTTCLPGMPKEYYQYVYLIEDESSKGIEKVLKSVLSLPVDQLHKKGNMSKQYVVENKNNNIQAGKVLKLITDC